MTHETAARALHAALAGGAPLQTLPSGSVPGTLEAAYGIQDRLIALDGRAILGWKLALSTAGAQAANGLDAPTVGPLLSGMIAPTGTAFAANTFRQPEIEPEFALVLAADPGADPDADAVRAATGAVRLAMEIADTRYVTKTVYGQPGIIADLNCGAGLVLGGEVPPDAVREARIQVSLGDGTRVAGFAPENRPDPFAATAFLCRFLAGRGCRLGAGDVITTGTCAPPTRTPPGAVRCDFGMYGAVDVTIAG
ncbi:2-keto-4-pentenoate hydratase [Roseovarius sp. MBR-78]|uniref:2-keto-4-pentenoate hydratase n=1 Tax=Roseovarius sp. MBR-78 TaxID=3156460 RepID=UPI003391321A